MKNVLKLTSKAKFFPCFPLCPLVIIAFSSQDFYSNQILHHGHFGQCVVLGKNALQNFLCLF